MKKLLLIVAILLAAGAVGTWLYADTMARDALESGSSRAFGTPTEVGLVKLGFMDASIGLGGYRVSSPEGFEDRSLFQVDSSSLEVGYGNISREHVAARRLTIDGVELNLLMDGTRSNFGPVLRHMRGLSGGAAGESGGPTFSIDEVEITAVTVNLDLPGVQRSIELPEIRLTGVGGEDGVWLSELSAIIVSEVMRAAARHGDLPPALAGALSGGLGNLPANVADAFRDRVREQVEEEAKGLLDQAIDAAGGDN